MGPTKTAQKFSTFQSRVFPAWVAMSVFKFKLFLWGESGMEEFLVWRILV